MTHATHTSLVIDSRNLERLVMDGPALKITMKFRSPIFFPLRRLSRIHIIGIPDCDMTTLLLCAEQSIPVAFFHTTGRLRCKLQPPYDTPANIDHWIEHIEFDPEAQGIYMEWQTNQALHVLSNLGFNIGACENRRKLVNESLRRICKNQMGKSQFNTALDWIDGLLQFHLEQLIEFTGLVHNSKTKKRLVFDIKSICESLLLHGLVEHIGIRREFFVSAKTMTDFYQCYSDHIEKTVKRMLSQLISRLEAIV